ncbi:MAG: PH domain-containing protein [Myxococcota bacterium]
MSEEQNQTAEEELWAGHPSQWTAFKFYLLSALLGIGLIVLSGYISINGLPNPELERFWYYPLFGLPVLMFAVLIRYLIVRTTHYSLTNERILSEKGIFSRDSEEIELYRVRDQQVLKPFWLRITGRGHVRILSTDTTAPDFMLTGITNPDKVRELLRTHVEVARDKKRVRHFDIDGGGGLVD